MADVDIVINTMGKPEDYLDADESSDNRHDFSNDEAFQTTYRSKAIYRDADNRLIGGVCAGLGHFFKKS